MAVVNFEDWWDGFVLDARAKMRLATNNIRLTGRWISVSSQAIWEDFALILPTSYRLLEKWLSLLETAVAIGNTAIVHVVSIRNIMPTHKLNG